MTLPRWLLLALLLAVTVAMDATEPDPVTWESLGFYSAWEADND